MKRPAQDVQKLPVGAPREALRAKGQFWTPDWIADAMVAFVLGDDAKQVFDPAVGAGVFFRAARRRAPSVRLRGAELHPAALDAALAAGLGKADLRGVTIGDFVLHPPQERLPAIVANPPYIRHHRLTPALKAKLRTFSMQFLGHAVDGRAGLHVYFLLRALERLAPGGRLAFIVPADLAEGVFAVRLWQQLTSRFRLDAVITFAPEAAPFPNVDTNALILLMSHAKPRKTIQWARCDQPETPALQEWIASSFRRPGPGLQPATRDLEEALRTGISRPFRAPAPAGGATLGDFATTMRGIATGANEFFFLTAAAVAELRLPMKSFRRAIGRTRDVQGEEIVPADLEHLDLHGRPTLLLSLNGDMPGPALQAYLRHGEALGLPSRALISTRQPWYKMEVRTPPPFLFAYLGRRSARFIRNRAQVVPLTGFLCVYPKPDCSSPAAIEALWQVLRHPDTVANLALVGKSYGDGAIKVEPRALERLPLPAHVLAAAGLAAPPARRQLRIAFAT